MLFDVFGTLVEYEADQQRLAYAGSHELLRRWGWARSHEDLVTGWTTVAAGLEARAVVDHREYGMLDIAAGFAEAAAPELTTAQQAALAAALLTDWKRGIRDIAGVAAMLQRLRGRYRIGVVSNTHDPHMVPELLAGLGVLELCDVVLLSVDHGHRKPHPSIYAAATAAIGCRPADVAFVGDTFGADFEGPTAAGMRAFLIDPARRAPVPDDRRLARVTDVEAALERAAVSGASTPTCPS